jgi:hypothetical protein
MSERVQQISANPDVEAWLRKLTQEFVKLEQLFPNFMSFSDNDRPQWVENVERQLREQLFPVAEVKDNFSLTPRRIGALIGHSCAFGMSLVESMKEDNVELHNDLELARFTPERLQHAEKLAVEIMDVWYPALRRLAKRALCSAVDQPYEGMVEFLQAYSKAFSKKPTEKGKINIGTSATEIYVFLIFFWRVVDAMKSVRQLHEILQKVFGAQRVGDLKRIEKMCNRIELHYGKPGRPKKAEIIPTPA